jgi:folate-dependent phosphoribosylglycinamide formyltransferase PurN
MAVVGGQIVPVVALGSPTGALLVCEVDGETVGFSGLEVHRVGTHESVDGGVVIDQRTVRDLELPQLLRSLEQALEPRIGESS